MTEHLLDDLHVGAAGDGEAGGGVPQLVRVQLRDADRGGRGVEVSAPEGGGPDRATASDGWEHQVVRGQAGDERHELLGEEGGEEHLARPWLFGVDHTSPCPATTEALLQILMA